jgi:hypothetical protein
MNRNSAAALAVAGMLPMRRLNQQHQQQLVTPDNELQSAFAAI